MGKRNRRADQTKTLHPPAFVPYSPQMDAGSKEKSRHPVGGTSAIKPMSSLMDIMESPTKLPNSHHSHAHRHHNLNRGLLLKLPRHYYGLQYPHRNSFNHSSTTTSHGKSIRASDDKLKSPNKSESQSAHHHPEKRGKSSRRLDRIRSSPLVVEMMSHDVMMKTLCGLCQKALRRKPCILETTISSNDLSVVAVLVCGHAYHAECLETKTSYGDRRDPPCPLCVNCSAQS